MLAENVEGIANATETVEMLNQAQENLQEVAKNPGIVGTWLQGLIPDLLNFAFQVVVAIIIYIVGSKIIGLILKMFRKSMERRDVDTGVRQFVLPLIKYALYLVLIFIIMELQPPRQWQCLVLLVWQSVWHYRAAFQILRVVC